MHAHNINSTDSHAKRQFDVEIDQFILEKYKKKMIKITKFKIFSHCIDHKDFLYIDWQIKKAHFWVKYSSYDLIISS